MFYYFEELTSTIDEAKDGRYRHGDVVVADHQTEGRGQRGRVWSAPAGENLMFSVVLDTSRLRTGDQFLLLQAVAMALVDMFAGYGLEARVKWTNDIYIGDRKITGVLIDHSSGPGGMLSRSGVGVGINVNQTNFEEWLPNPTSMARETGREFDRREVLTRFHERLLARFAMLDGEESREELRRDYHSKIYRLDTPARYALPDGGEFTGIVRGVGRGGELAIEHSGGALKHYLFREVSFVIQI
ncbi:MAG: biotin--[acetyl-CoA-carboxylase] ligase [Alistipes sp.]|jgi:BirA family biotin operon repressor/biotin-[acetyl-CoA-carboxylase] ligase|nr:biotin--[acetyl-CoA-carboxylase] ligase [Alistipes sp.]